MKRKKKRKGARNWGRCPKCGEFNVLERHHMLPQRFYGKNPFYIRLCDVCHEKVENLIPDKKILPYMKYFKIAYDFIYKPKLWPENFKDEPFP